MTNNQSNVQLSAPWYSLQRMASFSIGQSSQVLVSELDGAGSAYQLTVTAIKGATAEALAATLNPKIALGNITVNIVVKDLAGKTYEPGQPSGVAQTIELLKTALVNNPLVYGIEQFNNKAAICCTPTVVQFYNDNASNPSAFTSMLAEDAFKAIFNTTISVYTLGKTIGNF